MKRVPLVVVAVLVAMVVVAAALKWRARGNTARHVATSTSEPRRLDAAGAIALMPPSPLEPHHGTRMLHGDPRHTDRSAGRAPLTKPVLVWSYAVGGPVEAQVVTSPDQQTLYAASLDGSLTALSRADGTSRWKVDLGDRAYATPCIAEDGTIYAASDAKKVVALTPEGKTKWTLDADDEADSGLTLAKDGTIVFSAGRKVYGVTPQGFVKWRFAAKRKVYASPAVSPDGRVFFGSQDHRVYALTPQGGPLWSADLGDDVDGAPVLGEDGAIYVGTDGDEIVKLDPADGSVVWRRNVGGFVRGTLSMTRSGEVAAGVYGPTPRLVLLAEADGEVRVSVPVQGTGAREFGVFGGPLEDDVGVLLFGAQDDQLHAVDHNGQLLWSFTTGGDVDSPVTLLDDGSVVFGSDDSKVYMLRGE